MRTGPPGGWLWCGMAVLCVTAALGGPQPAFNLLKARLPAEDAVRASLGHDAVLENPVRIRPRHIGESGRRMAFKRIVICGTALTRDGRVRVAVVYPLRRHDRRPSVVTPANPGGTQGEGAFIGSAVLARCRQVANRTPAATDQIRESLAAAGSTIGDWLDF
jgi:hypothetical protein